MHHRIKEEISPYDQDDLDDEKLRVKAEELDEDEGGEYRPSDELTKAFASLQQEQPEEEGEEQNQPSSSNYVPSEDLLAALSSLPEGMVEINSSSSSSLVPPKIKAEPQDDDVLPLSRPRASLSESECENLTSSFCMCERREPDGSSFYYFYYTREYTRQIDDTYGR